MVGYIIKVDKSGRVHIPKKLKKNFGNRFIITRHGSKIVMTSIPDDPVKDLEELGEKLPPKSIKELRAEVLQEAYNDLRRY